MIEEILDRKSGFDLTSRSAFSKDEESFTSRSFAALLAKNTIPYSHRKVADNYTIIKRVFKFQAVQSRISNTERTLLAKYDFNVLEYTTIKHSKISLSVNNELILFSPLCPNCFLCNSIFSLV